MEYFYPTGVRCPHCGAAWAKASEFRHTRKSQLRVYRCRACRGIYNLYSGTIFEGRHLRPAQVVLLIRGVLKGESAASLGRELGMSRTTLTELRHLIQANAAQLQSETRLSDNVVETDELFQNAGEKGEEHFDPLDPPRRHANKRRGCGTYANERPPVLGVIGRETGQVRLRLVVDTRMTTLSSWNSSPNRMRWSTPTSTRVIMRFSQYAKRSGMGFMNGHVMTIAMVGLRPIPNARCKLGWHRVAFLRSIRAAGCNVACLQSSAH
jgi:hypothetical protein